MILTMVGCLMNDILSVFELASTGSINTINSSISVQNLITNGIRVIIL
jgi:hypothetical protein